MQDHTAVVVRVKAGLEARGVNLSGACGAWEITKRVQWELRALGAGALDKPGGNNCEGKAVDIVAFPDGSIYDVLVGSGDTNGPSWQDAGVVDPGRWRAPVDPGDVVDPPKPPLPPLPPLPPVVPAVDGVSAILARLDILHAEIIAKQDADTEKIQQQLDAIVKDAEKSLAAALPLLAAANPAMGALVGLFNKLANKT